MFAVTVVKCSDVTHKIQCFYEAIEAVWCARNGNERRNGRKVTIRGAITNPCTCHIDALIWLATDTADSTDCHPRAVKSAVFVGSMRAFNDEMR